jgi:hypothetical protein
MPEWLSNPFRRKMIYRLIVVRDINGLRRELYKKKIKENERTFKYTKGKNKVGSVVLNWSEGFIWATKKNVGYLMLDIDKGQLVLCDPKNKIQIDASYETGIAVGEGILKNIFAALVSTSGGTLPILIALICIIMGVAIGFIFGNIAPITAIQQWLSTIHF